MSDEDFVYKPMPPKRSYLDQYASNDLEAANERIAKLEGMVERAVFYLASHKATCCIKTFGFKCEKSLLDCNGEQYKSCWREYLQKGGEE